MGPGSMPLFCLIALLACGEPSPTDMEYLDLLNECVSTGSTGHCHELASRYSRKGDPAGAGSYYGQSCTKAEDAPSCYLAAVNYSMSPSRVDHDDADEMLAKGCALGDQKQCSGPKVDEIRARRAARGF